MPIKKKTTAAKKPAAKKPAVLGPKAKLMKLLVGTLRNKAKKLGISDVSKRTKENLAQSIMLAEARKKRGTAMGKKATAKKAASTRGADRQTPGTPNNSIKRDNQRNAEPPGRRTSKSGNVYSERRRDRSDKPGQLAGEKYQGWTNYETWLAALWIDNDQKLNNAFNASVDASQMKEMAIILLYDTQKFSDSDKAVDLWLADIVLNAYIEAVNWREIYNVKNEDN